MVALQPAMKKRQIIVNSNRMMFVWVAIMSAVVGICAVVGYFLWQQIAYKMDVTNRLVDTASTLKDNYKNAKTLVENVRLLETNQALNSVKAQSDEKALQVVLDALPADVNTLALGASLQQNLLVGIDGVTLQNLTVQPLGDTPSSNGQLPFSLVVRASEASALKDLLNKFERSIRVIDIDSISLEKSNNSYTMTIGAHAYYQVAKTIELTDKVVPIK